MLRSETHLLLDDVLVDFSSRDVVVLVQADIEVSLIVSEIQIRLSSIIEYIHLTCLSAFIISVPGELHVPCSVGAIVPASMFMYGSILIAVTFRPVVLRRRPVLDAGAHQSLHIRWRLANSPMTPLPIPLRHLS
jgi:hypothetical protein